MRIETELTRMKMADVGRRAAWLSHCIGGTVLVGILLASGCSSKTETAEGPTVTVQVDAAESQAISRKVDADATLYPLDQAAIVPKINAPVKKFYVDRGSKVHAGQLLAELENQDLQGAVTENQGGYQEAEAAYQTQLQKADQDLKYTKEVLDSQQRVFDSRESLFKQGAASAKDVDEARVNLSQARNQYELAQKQQDLRAAEGQVTAAKGKNESAAAQLSYARIVSPIDGVVTDRPLYPGEMPAAGTPLLTVMNLSQIVARSHVTPQEAATLRVGNIATLAVPGLAVPVKGKVTLVSPAVDPNSTTVEVWVQCPNPTGQLKPGTSAHVSMVAETVPKAVVIPAAALLTETDGVMNVIVLDTDNMPHKVHVKTGIRDGKEVQVTDGLKGGERVVTVGAFELDKEDDDVLPKTKIQVQAPKMPEEEEDE